MGDNMTREELNEEIQNEIFKEEKKESRKKIIKTILKVTGILIILLTLFYTYTTYISTVKIQVREYRIKNSKIPDSFKGTKIIQLSDLHYGSTMGKDEIKKIVKLTNDRKPDIIVFTGDLINKDYDLKIKEQEQLITQLKSMNATLGKYAIFGDEDNEKIATIYNQSDFTILRNEYDLIYKEDNNPILLVGLSSAKKDQNIEKAYSYFKEGNHNINIYTIAILHEPDTVDDILSMYQTDLFLGGHSHNGNIRLPIIHYTPFKINGAKKYDQDYYKIEQSELYISSGLGTKKGIRLFCRPSINFFRISNQ